jgi:hypothetical protein
VQDGLGELVRGEPEVGRGAGQPVPGQAAGQQRASRLVAAQVGAEQRAHPGQLAVVGGARVELLDRVQDLVVAAAARPARARHGHRDPGQDQRLGQHGEEAVVGDATRLVQHRLGGGPGQGDREAVDRFTPIGRGQFPVSHR